MCGSVKYSVVKMGDETNKSKLKSETKEHEQIENEQKSMNKQRIYFVHVLSCSFKCHLSQYFTMTMSDTRGLYT